MRDRAQQRSQMHEHEQLFAGEARLVHSPEIERHCRDVLTLLRERESADPAVVRDAWCEFALAHPPAERSAVGTSPAAAASFAQHLAFARRIEELANRPEPGLPAASPLAERREEALSAAARPRQYDPDARGIIQAALDPRDAARACDHAATRPPEVPPQTFYLARARALEAADVTAFAAVTREMQRLDGHLQLRGRARTLLAVDDTASAFEASLARQSAGAELERARLRTRLYALVLIYEERVRAVAAYLAQPRGSRV